MSAEVLRRIPRDAPAGEWTAHDALVASHPHGTLQQTYVWARFQATFPDRHPEGVFEVVEDGRTTFTASVISQRLPGGYTYLLIPRGFLTYEGVSPRTFERLCTYFRHAYPKALFVRFDPPVERTSPDATLFLGAMRSLRAHVSPVETTPTTTLVLDLSQPGEQLLARMHPKGRYNMKVATRHGVVCRTGTAADIARAYPLLRETAVRTGISVHAARVYHAMLESLGAHAALELAELEGELLAAIITTRFHGTTTYYYGASSSVRRECMAPYLLQWHAIRKARTQGDRRYDFLGIAPPGSTGHPLAGVTEFKRKFGGDVREEVPPHDVLLRPVLARLFRVARKAAHVLRRR